MTRPDVQLLIDDYAALSSRVSALESGRSLLLEPRHMRFLGGYRLPAFSIGGKATNGCGGSFDLRRVGSQLRVLAHHNTTTQRIVEMAVPATMGPAAQSVELWPLLIPGDASPQLFASEAATYRINPFGVLWDEPTQTCYVSSRHSYTTSSNAPLNWIARLRGPSIATASMDRLAPALSNDWYGCGFAHIPPSHRATHGGRRMAVAYGGYDRNANNPIYAGSSMGPSFAPFDDGGGGRDILNYPKGKPMVRDCAYNRIVHDLPNDAMAGLLKHRVGTVGYWQHDSAFAPAFVDHASFGGLACMGTLTRGCLDYRAQDVGWGMFVVKTPSWFYSAANTSTGHGTRNPSQEPWNMTQPPGIKAPVMFVYDPAQLAEVAAGSRLPHQCAPRQYDFACPIPGAPAAMQWDAPTNMLWVMILGAHGTAKLPALCCYELSRDASVNPPMKMPPGFALDSSGAMVAA